LSWNCSLWVQKPLTISKSFLPSIRICFRNSRLARLINLRRRNKWFLPFFPNLVRNTQCFYPHFIQLGSSLEIPGKFPLLRPLSSFRCKRRPNSLTWEKSKAQRHMHLLCKMVAVTKIRNIKKNTKGRDM
jgi:hypothetical protein